MSSKPFTERKEAPKLKIDVGIELESKTNDTAEEFSLKPKLISSSAWERFQALKRRTEAVTKHSTEKRIKVLKQNVLEKVQSEFTSDEDRDILREHDVKFGPPVKDTDTVETLADDVEKTEDLDFKDKEGWKNVKQYLDINKHLEQSTSSISAPKSGLEVKVNEAINKRDIHTAEVLSDQLAARDFGVKIAEAAAARDFLKRKKEEEHRAKEKRKKKLNWGFEHKQRWETKSNM